MLLPLLGPRLTSTARSLATRCPQKAVIRGLSQQSLSQKTPTFQLSHFAGPFNSTSRAHPSVAWLEAYTDNIRALGFSDPSGRWYAPSSIYTNGDGKIVRGGDEIWKWVIADIFGSFDAIDVADDETRVRVIHNGAPAYYEYDELRKDAPQDADVVLYEHIIIFHPRDSKLKQGGPIPVRRMMEWIVGRSENDLGWGGLQCWQGKVCWDTHVLKSELARRVKATAT